MLRKMMIAAALVGSAASAQQEQTYCIPNGPCNKEDVPLTPSPWWLQVASRVDNEENYFVVYKLLADVSSMKADLMGVRTIKVRMEQEELDKRRLQRTSDWIVEQTIQLDCKAQRYRSLEFQDGSASYGFKEMPVPMTTDHKWQALTEGFVYNALPAKAFADALC